MEMQREFNSLVVLTEAAGAAWRTNMRRTCIIVALILTTEIKDKKINEMFDTFLD